MDIGRHNYKKYALDRIEKLKPNKITELIILLSPTFWGRIMICNDLMVEASDVKLEILASQDSDEKGNLIKKYNEIFNNFKCVKFPPMKDLDRL